MSAALEILEREKRNAQVRADPVAQAFGDSVSPPHESETPLQYRRRLADKYKVHSKTWKDVDITGFDGKALDVVESQVYPAALQEARHPTNVEPGTLREVLDPPDASGRRIRRFYGDPEACWAPFKAVPRRVTGTAADK